MYPAEALIVRTLFDIKQGTELSVSYLPRFKMTYVERQRLLTQRYRFECVCPLCVERVKYDAHIKEYRISIMNGDRQWNCIQNAMEILNTHFDAFPTLRANVLSVAIDCATENYMYDKAYALIVESIALNAQCYGFHCKRWPELHEQILKLKRYSKDERCDALLMTHRRLFM